MEENFTTNERVNGEEIKETLMLSAVSELQNLFVKHEPG